MTDTLTFKEYPEPKIRFLKSLPGKLLLLLVVLVVCYGIGLGVIRHWHRTQMISALNEQVKEKQTNLSKLIALRGQPLRNFVEDYTYWDDLVNFINEPDSTWAEENVVESMKTFDASAVWIYDTSFAQVYMSKKLDSDCLDNPSALKSSRATLDRSHPFAHFFVQSPVGLLEIQGASVHPTADSKRESAPCGYFFVGRVWDDDYLAGLSDLVGGKIQINNDVDESTVDQCGYSADGIISLQHLLRNWSGSKTAQLSAEIFSPDVQQHLRTADRVDILGAALVVTLIGIVSWLLTFWVVLPLKKISAALDQQHTLPIQELQQEPNELGHISRLIRTFFEQKAELEKEIEDRRRAEDDREKLEGQLRRVQRLETIGTLAGGVAHDFNNILTPILGYSDMALVRLESDHPVRKDIEHVIGAAMRAKDLVKQILTFSRQGEQERRPAQLQVVFKEALKLMRASMPSTIDIQSHLDPSCGAVMCDPSQMHQVLMNLCTNAYQAMGDTDGVLDVVLEPFIVDDEFSCLHVNLTPGRYARLTVSDTGCGMDRATMERVFEPFFTTKKVGEGTGLGLSLVHGIVLAHGGGVTVYSETGKGTTFRVYLPCMEHECQTESAEIHEIIPGQERILFVDDEVAIANMGKQMLERMGYRVSAINDSTEALELFRRNPFAFDLLITDQTMPHITGDRLAKEILEIRSDIPIVLITGFSERVTPGNFRKLGISELVMKPLLSRDLNEAIRRALV